MLELSPQQQAVQQGAPMGATPSLQGAAGNPGAMPANDRDVFSAIERLEKLRADGPLTEEDLTAKKARLLGRL